MPAPMQLIFVQWANVVVLNEAAKSAVADESRDDWAEKLSVAISK